MKRISTLLATVTLLFLTTGAFAQQPAPEGGVVIRQERLVQGPDGAPPPPPPRGNFLFMATESFSGKVIKGAPYSAEAVTETVQTLADGNRIVNRITSSVYRDNEGRTRREQTLKGLGILGTGEEPLRTVFINDPVAGVTYSLDTRSQTAHKSTPFKIEWTKAAPGLAGAEAHRFEFKVAPGTAPSGHVVVTTPLGAGPQPGERHPLPIIEEFRGGVAGGAATATYVFRDKTGPNPNEVKEELGKQNIEGVEAEGTRTTITIPAGEIGNERAIAIVSERWYSPELQLVVMTRHSDPRSGETTYKLTNINRSEPAKTLFEVPAGYTVKEGPHMPPPAVAPLRMRKSTNPE